MSGRSARLQLCGNEGLDHLCRDGIHGAMAKIRNEVVDRGRAVVLIAGEADPAERRHLLEPIFRGRLEEPPTRGDLERLFSDAFADLRGHSVCCSPVANTPRLPLPPVINEDVEDPRPLRFLADLDAHSYFSLFGVRCRRFASRLISVGFRWFRTKATGSGIACLPCSHL